MSKITSGGLTQFGMHRMPVPYGNSGRQRVNNTKQFQATRLSPSYRGALQ